MAVVKGHIVSFWKGTRDQYDHLSSIDDWKRYIVTETNGTTREYMGTREITPYTGELEPVDSIVSNMTNVDKSVGTRYLYYAGSSNAYVVAFVGPTPSEVKINPIGDLSVRVKDRYLWRYQIVDGELISYDEIVDCGEY